MESAALEEADLSAYTSALSGRLSSLCGQAHAALENSLEALVHLQGDERPPRTHDLSLLLAMLTSETRGDAEAILGDVVETDTSLGRARGTYPGVPRSRLLPHVSHGIQLVLMPEVRQTEAYARWFRRLRDRQARAQIDVRIRRLSLGNPGDARPVGGGVSELRIDYGPGYRVYVLRRGRSLIVLLGGGDKDSQDRDIRRALQLAQGLQEDIT